MSEKKAKYKAGDKKPVVRFVLDKILKNQGMNKSTAAEKIGLSKTAIYNLTSVPNAVRMDTLTKICEALDLTPGDLFELDG